MVKIIIVNGLGESGKSQFVQFCSQASEELDHTNAFEFSTIDYVKSVAAQLGWDGTKDIRGREFLHDLKMTLEKWNDSPNTEVLKRIEEFEELKPDCLNLCFVNIREADSIKRFKAACEEKGYEVFTLLIVRPGYNTVEDPRLIGDIADGISYDFIKKNDGDKQDWYKKAEYFVEYFTEKYFGFIENN